MTVLSVPPKAGFSGFTLGIQVRLWMESWLVHGPGDVRARPYTVDPEKRYCLVRLYELHPPGAVSPEAQSIEGRRRIKRGGISVRKGWAKTEFGAAISAAELHPLAPVRFSHWAEEGEESVWTYLDEKGHERPYVYKAGEPVGVGVQDPYVPMVAYTEEQSEELAYGALLVMLGEGPLAEDFDLGAERIIVLGDHGQAAGKAVALSTSPDSRDGARTTFQLFDESHRLVLPRHKEAHQTMLANVPKRRGADAWSLEVTTSYEPGELSVAEGTMEYARKVAAGKVKDSRLFFYHRQASDTHDLKTAEGLRAAVVEASGPAVEWTDVDAIVELALDPQTDRRYWERVWLNRPVASGGQAFDVNRFDELSIPRREDGSLWTPERGALITLGLDGAKHDLNPEATRPKDSTGIVGTDLATGRQFVVAVWEEDDYYDGWEREVDTAVDDAFARWDVVRFYPDPPYWESYVATWAGRYGTVRLGKRRVPRVMEWFTNRQRQAAYMVRAYTAAMRAGDVTFNGDERLRSHLANARRQVLNLFAEAENGELGDRLYLIRKERPDSPFKIDLAMAGALSWEAHRDVIAAGGATRRSRAPVVY